MQKRYDKTRSPECYMLTGLKSRGVSPPCPIHLFEEQVSQKINVCEYWAGGQILLLLQACVRHLTPNYSHNEQTECGAINMYTASSLTPEGITFVEI